MAEVIQIQAPDQAPVAAPSLTQFADLEKTPQANTAVLPDTNTLNQQLLEASIHKHAWEQADYLRHQKAISDRIDKMNINTAGVWEVDMPEIQGKVNDYLDYVGKHPELEQPTAQNLQKYTELQQWKNGILMDADKSKQDKANYLEQGKFLQQHPNQAWNNPINQGILNDYANFNSKNGKSLRDRKFNGFQSPDTYNPITIAGKVVPILGTIDNSYEVPTGQGSQTRSVSVKETPYTGDKSVEAGITAIKNTPQDYQDIMRHYSLIKGNILAGKQPDVDIQVYDLKSGFNKNGQPKVVKSEKLSTASIDDIINSEYVPLLHKREVQQKLEGDATKTTGENKYADIESSVDSVHRMFFDPQMKGEYNKEVGGYELNSDYPQIAKAFAIKVPENVYDENGQVKLDKNNEPIVARDKNKALVKKEDIPEIFIRNDSSDPNNSRAVLVYSDGTKKEVAPQQLIEADLGSRGKSGRDYSQFMREINNDGTATYNPSKYYEHSQGTLPFKGGYQIGVNGEENGVIPINYDGKSQNGGQQNNSISGKPLTITPSSSSPSGLVEQGNIDLTKQPSIHNPETGGNSTVWSMSIGTDKGETLISRVTPDGKILSKQDAINYYKKTGNNLGTFKSVKDADSYAETLHNDYANGKIPTNENYAPNIETGINTVMQKNGISRERAIDALKKAGKL